MLEMYTDAGASMPPSLYFDPAFYLSRYSDVAQAGVNPWTHFMDLGRVEGRMPNPLFHPSYYRSIIPSEVSEGLDSWQLLDHYLSEGFRKELSPHPAFDVEFYKNLTDRTFEDEDPLTHYLAVGRKMHFLANKTLMTDLLHQRKYAKSDKDDMLGEDFKAMVDCFFDSPLFHELPFSSWLAIEEFKRSDQKGILFLGHEASLTGAPMVLLSLVERFAQDGYKCLVYMPRAGRLLSQFESTATTFIGDFCAEPDYCLVPFMLAIDSCIRNNRILAAVVNTAEIMSLQTVVKKSGLMVISVIHEIAHGYEKSYFEGLYRASDIMLFSSPFLLEQAREKAQPPSSVKTIVRSQGLLNKNFGVGVTTAARDVIREELGIPRDTFVILSCGSLDLRKGLDLFVRIAYEVVKNGSLEKDVCFVWIGDGPMHSYTPYYYANWDIQQSGLTNHVKIVTARENIEPWFVGADLFLLPSRQDPMPVVVHNAMACALPVLAFEKAGGTQELLSEGGGSLIEYGNINQMVETIKMYVGDADFRTKTGQRGKEIVESISSFSEYYENLRKLVETKLISRQPFVSRVQPKKIFKSHNSQSKQ